MEGQLPLNATPVNIEDEMRRSYIDYAMSVIIGRALPDVRDGLKPVHRRILYGMHEMGLAANKPYRKCAKIVGEVMGNFHPHGDPAIYDTMVRMAQDFSMRYIRWLMDRVTSGQLTGIRLRPCVTPRPGWPNCPRNAGRHREWRRWILRPTMMRAGRNRFICLPGFPTCWSMAPRVLPWAWPPTSLLTISTKSVHAAIHFINHPEATVPDLMQFIPGPDFPTGGFIYGRSRIQQAFTDGTRLPGHAGPGRHRKTAPRG